MTATAVRSLVLAQRQTQWNRLWRFSAAKPGLWLLLAQTGLAGLSWWRLAASGHATRLFPFLLSLAAYSACAGLLSAFTQGRERLFSARTLPLLHVTSAPSVSLPAALLAAAAPARAWSALLLSTAVGLALPDRTGLTAVPWLWAAGAGAGLLGEAAGLLGLLTWVRWAPRTLRPGYAVLLGLQAALMAGLVWLVAAGEPLAALAMRLEALQTWAAGATLLIVCPGGAMMLWLLTSPDGVGGVYREGWLAVHELGENRARPRRSVFPRLTGGPAGALHAKEWVLTARNPFTLLRLAVWGAGAAGLFWAGHLLAEMAPPRRDTWSVGLGADLALFAFGEVMAAAFSTEGPRLALQIMAGVRPGLMLAGKLVAAAPAGALASLGTWAAAAGSGATLAHQAGLAWKSAAAALGAVAVILGLAAMGAALPESAPEHDSDLKASAFEQLPLGVCAWVGLTGGAGYAAFAVWAGATGQTDVPRLLDLVALLAAPAAALLAGWAHLRRMP